MNRRDVVVGCAWLCVGVAVIVAAVVAWTLGAPVVGGGLAGVGVALSCFGIGWASHAATHHCEALRPPAPLVLCACGHDAAYHAYDGCTITRCRCVTSPGDVEKRWRNHPQDKLPTIPKKVR